MRTFTRIRRDCSSQMAPIKTWARLRFRHTPCPEYAQPQPGSCKVITINLMYRQLAQPVAVEEEEEVAEQQLPKWQR